MSEPIIRDAFTYGAGDGEPSAAMWEHVRTAILLRRQRRLWWRRLAVAAATVLMLAAGGVAAVPGARAAVIDTVKGWVTVWQGKVGQTDAVLNWADEAQGWEVLEQQGIHTLTAPWTQFGTVAEAAAFLDYPPAEAHLPEASVSGAEAQRVAVRAGAELRMVTVKYQVGKELYRVFTGAEFRREAGAWTHHPYERIEALYVTSQAPTNVRSVDLGGTEALCYLDPDPVPDTVCNLLIEGRGVAIEGPNPETVIALAKSVVK